VLDEAQELDFPRSLMLLPLVRILLERGQADEARVFVSSHPATSTDRQTQAAYVLVTAWLHAAEGQPRKALAAAEASLEQWRALDQFHYVTEALAQAADSAFELGDLEHVDALIVNAEKFPLIRRRPYLDAQTTRLRAKLAGRRGEPADEGFADATRRLRELEMPYWTAVTLVVVTQRRQDASSSSGLGACPGVVRGALLDSAAHRPDRTRGPCPRPSHVPIPTRRRRTARTEVWSKAAAGGVNACLDCSSPWR
jgi:hypothetical protein